MSSTGVPDLTQDAIEAAQDAVEEFERAGLTPPRRLLIIAQRPGPGSISADDETQPRDVDRPVRD